MSSRPLSGRCGLSRWTTAHAPRAAARVRHPCEVAGDRGLGVRGLRRDGDPRDACPQAVLGSVALTPCPMCGGRSGDEYSACSVSCVARSRYRSAGAGGGCLSGQVQGRHPRPHRVRSACLPHLVHRTAAPAARGATGPHRAVRPLDQEVRRFKPSTVSRRMSVVAGFYRTCVIDQVLATSPADYVRRPNVPPNRQR